MSLSWWKAFWAASIAALFTVAWWSNTRKYGRSRLWTGIKSGFDVAIVLTLALRMPMLLCAYVVMWLTRPLKAKPVLRTTLSVLAGISVGVLSGFAIEFVVLAGIIAIDQVTGGVWKYWNEIGAERIDWKREVIPWQKRAA